jgi:hypothetical protein
MRHLLILAVVSTIAAPGCATRLLARMPHRFGPRAEGGMIVAGAVVEAGLAVLAVYAAAGSTERDPGDDSWSGTGSTASGPGQPAKAGGLGSFFLLCGLAVVGAGSSVVDTLAGTIQSATGHRWIADTADVTY